MGLHDLATMHWPGRKSNPPSALYPLDLAQTHPQPYMLSFYLNPLTPEPSCSYGTLNPLTPEPSCSYGTLIPQAHLRQ